MKTYVNIPKKYRGIDEGAIKVIDGYAYTVQHAHYTGQRDYVYRISIDEYNALREDALYWEIYQAEPTEENLQRQIASYIKGVAEIEPYIQTTKY